MYNVSMVCKYMYYTCIYNVHTMVHANSVGAAINASHVLIRSLLIQQ